MPITPADLKAEILADPAGRGYAPYVADGNHAAVARLLNQPLAASLVRASVPTADLLAAVDWGEYAAATAAQKEAFARLTSQPTVIPRAPVRNLVNTMFGAGSATRPRLDALVNLATSSRAEQLGGEGTVVRHEDVSAALAS